MIVRIISLDPDDVWSKGVPYARGKLMVRVKGDKLFPYKYMFLNEEDEKGTIEYKYNFRDDYPGFKVEEIEL